jgi:SAM-dependent methyltransferase
MVITEVDSRLDEVTTRVSEDIRWFRDLLICPDCGSDLCGTSDLNCTSCGFSSPTGKDLRTRNPRPLTLSHPRIPAFDLENTLSKIEFSRPKNTYEGPLPRRDSVEYLSVISSLMPNPGRVLDLGCGQPDQAVSFEHLGHSYVGFDYSNVDADFLADAHSIPFKDSSFDCVFSRTVFQHLHNPFVAIQEVVRVLKPGGIFVGSWSQLEPFQASYFNVTAWGLVSVAASTSSLRILRMWPSSDMLRVLSRVGRYPRVIRYLLGGVHFLHEKLPWLAPRKAMWPQRDLEFERIHQGGLISFCMIKAC